MSSPGVELRGRSLHPGSAHGMLLVLDEPLSFWGGVSPDGTVVDVHHPQVGASLSGRVVALPSGRGSSSSTALLAELIRSGSGPSALLLAECDTILVVGALVAAEMYDVELPVVELEPRALDDLPSGALADVHAHTAPMDAIVRVETP